MEEAWNSALFLCRDIVSFKSCFFFRFCSRFPLGRSRLCVVAPPLQIFVGAEGYAWGASGIVVSFVCFSAAAFFMARRKGLGMGVSK